MRRLGFTTGIVALLFGFVACGEPSPKVGEPSAASPSDVETVYAADPTSGEPVEPVAEEPVLEDEFDIGDTFVSQNDSYRMTAIGQWNIARGEPMYPGYPEDDVDDPAELWELTHPEVNMRGEILLGMDVPQTSSRPLFVVESMTEEELPDLSSYYGNAYLVEGIFESAGEQFYRATIVTDHRQDRQISEAQEYFGDRTPAPRFYLMMHGIAPEDFAQYRDSQARQDLLQMLRTFEIADPEAFAEGVDLENEDLFDQAP